jgi:predicted transcriptional regulator
MIPVSGNSQQELPARAVGGWDFLTNHAHVLTCVAHDPGIRLREIAAAVGVTERAAHRILSELVEEGYVLRERQGRRNRYQVVAERPMRHPLVQEREIGELLRVLLGPKTGEPADTLAGT